MKYALVLCLVSICFSAVKADEPAGPTTPKPQTVILIDPPPPSGTIEGKVQYGERVQSGLTVVLKDAEGKEKGNVKSNDKGKFKFEKVLPGKYAITTNRKDSGVGAKAKVDVVVEADKTAKVTLDLTRLAEPAK